MLIHSDQTSAFCSEFYSVEMNCAKRSIHVNIDHSRSKNNSDFICIWVTLQLTICNQTQKRKKETCCFNGSLVYLFYYLLFTVFYCDLQRLIRKKYRILCGILLLQSICCLKQSVNIYMHTNAVGNPQTNFYVHVVMTVHTMLPILIVDILL